MMETRWSIYEEEEVEHIYARKLNQIPCQGQLNETSPNSPTVQSQSTNKD